MSELARKIRSELGWSQQRLAAHIGLTQGEISHIETGRRSPSIRTNKKLLKLATSHGIDISLEDIYGVNVIDEH